MAGIANFPQVGAEAGMYESFYLRAVAPDRPVGIWLRETVHKRPSHAARGSVWCTVFDAARGAPFMHKLTSERLMAPPSGWIEVGDVDGLGGEGGTPGDDGGEGASMSGEQARGSCGQARWSLRIASEERELRHLPKAWMYRARRPRTKLTSPAPVARFDGVLELAGREALELEGWRGMVGHNWGSEHAERWIWLHGVGFEEAPEAWLDVALGRVKIAGRLTPWIANGAFSLSGERYRIGGLRARGLQVAESPEGCELRLLGEGGIVLDARVRVPSGSAAGWRYADPEGSSHDVVNCSVAAVELDAKLPESSVARSLHSSHGGAYELGMRERDHGIPIAPFPDG